MSTKPKNEEIADLLVALDKANKAADLLLQAHEPICKAMETIQSALISAREFGILDAKLLDEIEHRLRRITNNQRHLAQAELGWCGTASQKVIEAIKARL